MSPTLRKPLEDNGAVPRERVYVATSWRNTLQPSVVATLREAGYDVYDFQDKGFAFGDVPMPHAKGHESMEPNDFLDLLTHEMCGEGFDRDFEHLEAADIVVLLLPSERDAHLELGYACGAGKQTHIVLDAPCKASLMYRMVDFLHPNVEELYTTLGVDR